MLNATAQIKRTIATRAWQAANPSTIVAVSSLNRVPEAADLARLRRSQSI
jgi:hypothetical protein